MVLSPLTPSLPTLLLKPGRWTVGSAATCSYRIVAEGVRPRHALLLCGGQTTLLKAWDTNTWHNGQPVRGEVRLQTGDRVTVGSVEFSVEPAGSFDVLAQLPDAPHEVTARPQSTTTSPPEPDGWDLERLRGQIQDLRDELSQRVSRRTVNITIPPPLPSAATHPDVERMSARVAELEQSADDARQLAEQTQQELSTLRAEQARRDEEWQHDREQLLAEGAEHEHAWQQQAAAWAVEHEQWQDELLSLANARQQLATKFEQRQSELQTEATRWQTECEELRADRQQQQAAWTAEHTRLQAESLRQKDDVAQQVLQAAAQHEQELAQQSQQVAAERQQIQATQLESKQVLAELLAERQRVEAERQRVEAERQQIEADRQQLQAARLESEQAFAELSAERQRVEDRAADVLSKSEDFTRRLAEFEPQQAQLTRDQQVLEHSRNWVQTDRRKLVEEKAQWQQQCADRQAEREGWEAERTQQQLHRDEFEKTRGLWSDEHDGTQQLATEREQFAAERAAWTQQREQSETERQANTSQLEAAYAELQSQQQALHDEQDRQQTLRADWDARAAEVQIERLAADTPHQTLSVEHRAWEDDHTAWETDLPPARPQPPTLADEPFQSLTDAWSIGVDLTAPREMPEAEPPMEPVAELVSVRTVDDPIQGLTNSATNEWQHDLESPASQAPTSESPKENAAGRPLSAMETLDSDVAALRAELAEKFHLPGLRETRPETSVTDEPVVDEPTAPPSPGASINILESLAFSEDEHVDDSVSRYMQHLLARSQQPSEVGSDRYVPANTFKSSGTDPQRPTAMPTPVASPNTVAETEVTAESGSPVADSPSNAKLRALQASPVHRQDKDAIRAATEKMRQVANQQTLTNVEVSNRSRLKRSIKTKSSLAAFAFVLSAGLLLLGYYYQPDFLVLGVCAAGLGVMTWVDLFIAVRESRRRTSQLAGRKKKA